MDLGKIGRRDIAVCCPFDGVNVRLDGVTPWFVTKIGDEWFGVEDDRFGNRSPRRHPSASLSSA